MLRVENPKHEKNEVLRRMWDRVLDHMERDGSAGSDKKPCRVNKGQGGGPLHFHPFFSLS
jgi:hypothetical protein